MPKRSGTHRLQRERRKLALKAREQDVNHVARQTWTEDGRCRVVDNDAGPVVTGQR